MFAGGYILTHGVRKLGIQGKAAQEAFRQLVPGTATAKYFGAGAPAVMAIGQSTKSMTDGGSGAHPSPSLPIPTASQDVWDAPEYQGFFRSRREYERLVKNKKRKRGGQKKWQKTTEK